MLYSKVVVVVTVSIAAVELLLLCFPFVFPFMLLFSLATKSKLIVVVLLAMAAVFCQRTEMFCLVSYVIRTGFGVQFLSGTTTKTKQKL